MSQAGGSEAHARAFRDCVGAFATGVTVVAVDHDGERAGMTLNAFTSVSLDPFTVLVSLGHGSRTHQLVCRAGSFTVSILAAGQEQVARAFAEPGAPFPAEFVVDGSRVSGAVGVLRCELRDRFDAGDHDLVLGRVQSFESTGGEPLVFHRGAFGAINRAADHRP